MEYQIVLGTDAEDLQGSVNAEITEGWEPIGGVAQLHLGYIGQAMVRRKSKVEKPKKAEKRKGGGGGGTFSTGPRAPMKFIT